MSEKPPFWLNEEGDYWTPADTDANDGALLIMEDEQRDELWLIGKTTVSLRDCPVDHYCDDEAGPCTGCDYHETGPCPRETEREVWHFSAERPDGDATLIVRTVDGAIR